MNVLKKIYNTFRPDPGRQLQTISVNDLLAYAGQTAHNDTQWSLWDGGKFPGGFGATQLYDVDYWDLRAKSSQLFTENHYARGIIRRFVTNVINTGLMPESGPEAEVLGLDEEVLADWSDVAETRFELWGRSPLICHRRRKLTWGGLQRVAYLEALVAGDVLVTLSQDARTGLPQVDLVNGSAVKTPWDAKDEPPEGHVIKHGVEFDKQGREVAYWVQQADLSFKRVAAFGRKTGRVQAWLVYGCEKRLDEVRGMPLLAVVLQSLKEIDRYRDSAQRKGWLNSIITGFVKRSTDALRTGTLTGAAVKRGESDIAQPDGTSQKLAVNKYLPGVFIEHLASGEDVVLKGGEGTDINFSPFEETIISSIAWALELPPEILRLSFSSNYSASQAAINEVKAAINLKWGDWGETFCQPIWQEFLVSETLNGAIDADGLFDAWRDPRKYAEFAAWVSAEWYGAIKPSTDIVKQAKGSRELLDLGLTTHARESRITTGTKFDRNMKRQKREREKLAAVMEPVLKLQAKYGTQQVQEAAEMLDALQAVQDKLEDVSA